MAAEKSFKKIAATTTAAALAASMIPVSGIAWAEEDQADRAEEEVRSLEVQDVPEDESAKADSAVSAPDQSGDPAGGTETSEPASTAPSEKEADPDTADSVDTAANEGASASATRPPSENTTEAAGAPAGQAEDPVADPEATIGNDAFATFEEAVAAAQSGETITLQKDVACESVIMVSESITIDGAGHRIDSSATRTLRIDTNDITVNLRNIDLIGGAATERGVQVDVGIRGVKLNIERCTVTAYKYAVNICNDTSVDLVISDSNITGWGALNLWGDNYSVKVTDSILKGINDKPYDANGWNGFGVVVLEGDTTGNTQDHVSGCTVDLVDCTVIAESLYGNRQRAFLFNAQSQNNAVTVSGESTIVEYPTTMADRQFCVDNGTDNALVVSAGTFSDDVSEWCAPGLASLSTNGGASFGIVDEAVVDASVTANNGIAVAQVGDTFYGTLQAATAAAAAGETIALLSDVVLDSPVYVTQPITIDLAGRTVAASDCYAFWAYGGFDGATIKNGSVKVSGNSKMGIMATEAGLLTVSGVDVTASDSALALYVSDATVAIENSELATQKGLNVVQVINGGTLDMRSTNVTADGAGSRGVVIGHNATATIDADCVIDGGSLPAIMLDSGEGQASVLNLAGEAKTAGAYAAIQTNGGSKGSMTINLGGGAKVSADILAIYLAAADNHLTVGDAEVRGATGIEIRGGSLTVNDGAAIASTATELNVEANGNGSTVKSGAAVAVCQHTHKAPIAVAINGGALSGPCALYESNPQGNAAEDIAKVQIAVKGGTFTSTTGADAIVSQNKAGFVSGGTFSSQLPEEYLADGYQCAADGNGAFGVKPEVEKPTKPVTPSKPVVPSVPTKPSTPPTSQAPGSPTVPEIPSAPTVVPTRPSAQPGAPAVRPGGSGNGSGNGNAGVVNRARYYPVTTTTDDGTAVTEEVDMQMVNAAEAIQESRTPLASTANRAAESASDVTAEERAAFNWLPIAIGGVIALLAGGCIVAMIRRRKSDDQQA